MIRPEFGMELYSIYALKYAVMRGTQGLLRSQLRHYMCDKVRSRRLSQHDKDKARKLCAYTNGLLVYEEVTDRIYYKGNVIKNAKRLTDDDWRTIVQAAHRKLAA